MIKYIIGCIINAAIDFMETLIDFMETLIGCIVETTIDFMEILFTLLIPCTILGLALVKLIRWVA